MSGGESSGAFDMLFKMHVPHILKKIFFFLDYNSFKECMEVNSTWKALLKSESYLKKGKALFHEEILVDENRLFVASEQGRTDEVRSILSSGMVEVDPVDPDDFQKRAPLHLAAMNGHADVVKVLLGFGSDPNRAQCWKSTPLHYAAINGHKKVVEVLLDSGANPNLADTIGYTPLLDAAFGDHTDVAQVLLEGGADPNKATNHGRAPLHSAAFWGNERLVKMLLEFGADPQTKDNTGITPLDMAVEWEHREVRQMLFLHIRNVGKEFVAGK